MAGYHQKSSKIKVSQHLQIISDANLADHLSSPAETKGGRCTSAQCQDGPCSGYDAHPGG